MNIQVRLTPSPPDFRDFQRIQAFTLIEVLVASVILVLTLMGILNLCASGFKTARAMQVTHMDASSLAAQLSVTNRLEEGVESGDFSEVLGDAGGNATWIRSIREIEVPNGKVLSTKLFQVDFQVTYLVNGRPQNSEMSILLYKPQSQSKAGANPR